MNFAPTRTEPLTIYKEIIIPDLEFAVEWLDKGCLLYTSLNYKWSKDIKELDAAVPLLEKSLEYYRQLVDLTKDTYLYAFIL